MSKNNGGSPEFKPLVGVLIYGGKNEQTELSLKNQTYPLKEIRISNDTDSFLQALNELAGSVEIISFCKSGSIWNSNRTEVVVGGFSLEPPSIGVVYHNWDNIFNFSYSVNKLMQNPDFVRGDISISSVSLQQKQINIPKTIDKAFFYDIMKTIAPTHVFIHIAENLGKCEPI